MDLPTVYLAKTFLDKKKKTVLLVVSSKLNQSEYLILSVHSIPYSTGSHHCGQGHRCKH